MGGGGKQLGHVTELESRACEEWGLMLHDLAVHEEPLILCYCPSGPLPPPTPRRWLAGVGKWFVVMRLMRVSCSDARVTSHLRA